MRKLTILIAIASLFASCKKEFDLDLNAQNKNLLVVEGMITDQNEPQVIELTRTVSYLKQVKAQAVENASRKGQPPIPRPLQQRMDAIASQLAVQRESIARLAVVTDRQVAGLVPAADPASTTYGNGLGPRATQPGGARIYRSAG